MAEHGGRLGSAVVVALMLAMLGGMAAFAWLRLTLPSEPAIVSIDAWDWSEDGVLVVPLGDGGPFLPGDRVTAVDGVPLGDLVAAAVAPWTAEPPRAADDATRTFARTFRAARAHGEAELSVAMAPQPTGGLLVAALPLLAYTLVQAAVAVLAWLRRPGEGWRRGFLAGSVANVANALTWELGLRVTDLGRPEPMLLLFGLGVPLHVLFWSSIAHVMVSWPTRARGWMGGRAFVVGLYVLPQLALVGLAMAAALVAPSASAWLGLAERLIALVVMGQIVVVLVVLAAAYRRFRGAVDRRLRLLVAACTAGALAVGGLTVGPLLLTGSALAPRGGVAALGIPLAAILLVGTLRSRLFEVDLLIASRRRLIVAREDERRRIRRDLHDGIGPMLAVMTLKADLARDLVREDPDAADAALVALKVEAQAAVAEIRRLTRALRPTVLDELGLVAAIRERAAELGQEPGPVGGPRVSVTVVGTLPPLDVAVEVAAYRIALEAMTNVIRHAGASRCEVRLAGEGNLVLEVHDDGTGIPPGAETGVGLTSMRERCAELGGRLVLERTGDGWTIVRAILPPGG